MAKTKPIGVRFDEDLLAAVGSALKEVTPQKALSIYEQFFKKHLDENIQSISGDAKINIYKLVNPLNNTVFYIGRTSFEIEKRLAAHIREASDGITITSNHNKRKIAVIKEILSSKRVPLVELLEAITPISDSEFNGYHEREIFWMVHYLKEGHPITNKISQYMISTCTEKPQKRAEVIKKIVDPETNEIKYSEATKSSFEGKKTIKSTDPEYQWPEPTKEQLLRNYEYELAQLSPLANMRRVFLEKKIKQLTRT